MAERTPDEQLAHAALERWARWWSGGSWPVIGFGESTLAKAMRSMPSTRCPTCRGTGAQRGSVCRNCDGLGRVRLDKPDGRANPAFIYATGGHPTAPAPPPLVSTVDRTLRQESTETRIAVITRYVDKPDANLSDQVAHHNLWCRLVGAVETTGDRGYSARIQRYRQRLADTIRSEARDPGKTY